MSNKLIKIEKVGCVPCSMVQNFLDDQGVAVEKYDIFENPELGSKYDIASVPVTILVNKNGEELQRSIGFKPDELEQLISQL